METVTAGSEKAVTNATVVIIFHSVPLFFLSFLRLRLSSELPVIPVVTARPAVSHFCRLSLSFWNPFFKMFHFNPSSIIASLLFLFCFGCLFVFLLCYVWMKVGDNKLFPRLEIMARRQTQTTPGMPPLRAPPWAAFILVFDSFNIKWQETRSSPFKGSIGNSFLSCLCV